jgi:uncharacterized protein YgiM (DUF1202 family)
MSVRSLVFKTVFSLAVVSPVAAGIVLAQAEADQAAPEVANAKFKFAGVVNSNSVYVRSGPGENYYPTLKLDKGAQVTVVGIKFDWLKILPPEGSFSYVAKVHVTRRGDGSVGRVSRPELIVKAGSTLNTLKYAVQSKLNEGEDVQIIGEQDEYFKIKPPKDAYLYVNKQFVDPVKPIKVAATHDASDDAAGSDASATAHEAGTDAVAANADTHATVTPNTTAANAAGSDHAAAPSTQPADATASAAPKQPSSDVLFDQLEAEFLTASKQPLDQQPVASLFKQYQDLSAHSDLPESMRRIADRRIATLKLRSEALEELKKARAADAAAAKLQQARVAEQQELEQRIKANDVKIYTAVGTLRTSSLQNSNETLYRLTDPNTGRTVVYIRSSDTKTAGLLGQFIGVKGSITTDAAGMKIITPTDVEAVDQNLVGTKVAAQLLPPSLLPKASASTGNE